MKEMVQKQWQIMMEYCGQIKNIEEGIDPKNLQEITIKYHSDHRKHKHELIEEPNKQVNRVFIHKKLAIKVIVDCRATSAQKFRTRLGFKQYDVVLTKT